MDIIRDWLNQTLKSRPRTVLTIGVFDGLHLGHQFLIKRIINRANILDAQSLVLTFDPHPLSVLSPSANPEILTTFGQKSSFLESMGLNILGCLNFNQALSSKRPLDFLDEIILSHLVPVEILVGPDFRFGLNAEGHIGLIKQWARGKVIKVRSVTQQKGRDDEIYSSSHIRGLLKVGLVESAARALGRWYRISGKVVAGQARGRKLGFPTANLGQIVQLIPGPGVYAVRFWLDGQFFSGVTSIGHNPTFDSQYLTVETHLFDFSSDVYGQDAELEFVARLRGMIRFDSPEALVKQINADEKKAREILMESA